MPELKALFLKNPPTSSNNGIGNTGFILGLAALALGQALQNGSGTLTVPAILWLTVSLIFLGFGLISNQATFHVVFQQISLSVIILGLLWQVYQLANTKPGIYLAPSSASTFWLFSFGVVIAGSFALLSLSSATWIRPVWQNVLVGLALLVIWFLGVWMIKASPNPFIDAFVVQQMSGEALLQGQDPYTQTPPDIYGNATLYAPGVVNNGRLTIGTPYLPLSIYFSSLGYFAGGDIRYSHLLALVLSGAFIAFLHPGRESKLAAYIFLFTPRIFFVLEQSWTEPIVVFFMTAAIFCATRYPRWLPFMLGLLFASKQYFLFIIPLTLLLIPKKSTWRNWFNLYSPMGGIMVAVTAPLAFWNLPAFLWSVGLAHLRGQQLLRLDSLSYIALYAHIFTRIPSPLISSFALGIAFFLVWRFAPRTLTGFIISIAWCLEIFLAFNRQAFCNYYFLVIGINCCAFALVSSRQPVIQQAIKLPEQQINHF